MPKPTNPARNAELAAIHIAKAQANMADDSYRDMLWTLARVRSAADLDYAGRHKVLDHLRRLTGSALRAGDSASLASNEWDFAKTMPDDKQKMLWKIRRLCKELKIRQGNQVVYAEGVARRQLGIERKLRMMEAGELWRLIGPLENTLKHRRPGRSA